MDQIFLFTVFSEKIQAFIRWNSLLCTEILQKFYFQLLKELDFQNKIAKRVRKKLEILFWTTANTVIADSVVYVRDKRLPKPISTPKYPILGDLSPELPGEDIVKFVSVGELKQIDKYK